MPTYEFGDMWSVYPDGTDHFLITTNSFVRVDGCLVMGRGIAKQACDRIPDLARTFGRLVAHFHGRPYHVLLASNSKIGLFQVKRNFYDAADPQLIAESAKRLTAYAMRNPHLRFDLNYPGIGNGHLTVAEVEPLLQRLPANVHVWRPADARKQDPPQPVPGGGATRVVHAGDEVCDVYIGRNAKLAAKYPQQGARFGNPVRLGKPCPVCGETHQEKGSTLACYKTHLWQRVCADPDFRRQLWALQGKALGCHCHPEPCHGDIIVQWLNAGGPYKNGNGQIQYMQPQLAVERNGHA